MHKRNSPHISDITHSIIVLTYLHVKEGEVGLWLGEDLDGGDVLPDLALPAAHVVGLGAVDLDLALVLLVVACKIKKELIISVVY